MSYEALCDRLGWEKMERVVRRSTLNGVKEWQKGAENEDLEVALQIEFGKGFHTRNIVRGSYLVEHRFPKETFNRITWSMLEEHWQYFCESKHYEVARRILYMHGINLPASAEPFPDDVLTPMRVGGYMWYNLRQKDIKTLGDLRMNTDEFGACDITSCGNHKALARWLRKWGLTPTFYISGIRFYLHIPQWATQEYPFMTTKLSVLEQLNCLPKGFSTSLELFHDLTEWQAAGYPIPTCKSPTVAARYKRVRKQIEEDYT